MINFNEPPYTGKEIEYIGETIKNKKICGDGIFGKKCSKWMEEEFKATRVLLTTSCTHALEMSAILAEIKPNDEVIMPSFTFVSTANAFVLRGAKIIFVDIRPDTMNIDETKIESAISSRTKAIVVVHYAGIACEMDTIKRIAQKHALFLIEDAAQGVMSTYKGQALGTIGDFGSYSFHETKNYSMGEGGAIIINQPSYVERAEIIREKGTNRSKFFRGEIAKYTWVDQGSSYLPSDINAAYLWAQLEMAEIIKKNRMDSWNRYHENLEALEVRGFIRRPVVPKECQHNAHIYYIKTTDIEERSKLIEYLRKHNILAVFHYIPLHSSEAGLMYSRFNGEDEYTTRESEKLVRLPMYYGIKKEDIEYIVSCIYDFYLHKVR